VVAFLSSSHRTAVHNRLQKLAGASMRYLALIGVLAHAVLRLRQKVSKYPPAEPGALFLEPLKAASGVADAAPFYRAT
jgi:hypothetical protein